MDTEGVPKPDSSVVRSGGPGKPSNCRAGPTLVAAALLAVIIGLPLFSVVRASAAEGVPALPASQDDVLVADVTPGDIDCDGDIDVVDAVLILRHVASLPAASGCGAADVNCSGAVDAVDALALLRDMARLPPLPLPGGCPGVDAKKVTPFVAIGRLECEPATIAPGQATDCHYYVGSSGADHELTWDFDGGSAKPGPGSSSTSCPPDHLPCTFGLSGSYSVTFQGLRDRTIALTACAMETCDSKTVSVAVTAAGAR